MQLYIPKNPSIDEVEKALINYEEVPFIVVDGNIVSKTSRGEYMCKDYSGSENCLYALPVFANRPECLSCFFIIPNGGMFYQTAKYVRIYNDDMSLKKLYLIEE